MPKILVINGHGTKVSSKKVRITGKSTVITPGPAEQSYVLSFSDMSRHLEEQTQVNKVWPIINADTKADVQWHEYSNTEIDEIDISPLQSNFSFDCFKRSLLDGSTGWDRLTRPSHSPLDHGALVIKNQYGQLEVLEGDELKNFLQQPTPLASITPICFCDKLRGKVKPMGEVQFSEILAGLKLINEFKDGIRVIVATCSPEGTSRINLEVDTSQVAEPLDAVVRPIDGGLLVPPVEFPPAVVKPSYTVPNPAISTSIYTKIMLGLTVCLGLSAAIMFF